MKHFAASVLIGTLAFCVLPAEAQEVKPGSVMRLTTDSVSLRGSKDPYSRVKNDQPARFMLAGPARFQVDFRVMMGPGVSADKPVRLIIFAEGQAVRRFRVKPKASTDQWRRESTPPSESTGFFVEVHAGTKEWEFHVEDAPPEGAAIQLISADSATTQLPATAPVVRAAGALPLGDSTTVVMPGQPTTPPKTVIVQGPRQPGPPLDLSKVSAIGAGVRVETSVTGAAGFLSYRLWINPSFGIGAGATVATQMARTPVGSTLAMGQGYRTEGVVSAFWNAARKENSAFFLTAGAGPVFAKEPRQDADLGLRAGGGLGLEFTPETFPALGFTLEGGVWVTSFQSPDFGTSVTPTITATFHYLLNRS